MSEREAQQIIRRVHELVGQQSPRPLVARNTRETFRNGYFRVEEAHVASTVTGVTSVEPRIGSADPTLCLAVVVPVLQDGQMVLWVRYRFAPSKWSVEFPRVLGTTIDEGWRDPVEKQLRVEAGLHCPDVRLLGAINSDMMFVSTSTIVVCGEECQDQGKPETDGDPSKRDPLMAGTVNVSPECIDHLIRLGTIECGLTLAALTLYRSRNHN